MTRWGAAIAIKGLVTLLVFTLLWILGSFTACSPGHDAPSPASPEPAPADGRWNVLVLVPDTVRGDHLSINGYERTTTPRLDALAREGINYTRAVTVAPRTWQSFSSILTGLVPPHHGVRFIFDHPIPPETPSLGSLLGANGYATAAFDVIPFLRGMTGGRGFDVFHTAGPGGTNEQATPDETIIEQVGEWISEPRDGPFLAFVRLTGGHWPYTQGSWAHTYHPCDDCGHGFNYGSIGVERGPGNEGFVVSDRDAYYRMMWQLDADAETRAHRIAHYDSELRAVDALIGDLLERLERDGILERTIVVVTSDHGESFGEHGYLQHGPRVDEPVMRVPLILWLPPSHPEHRSGVVRDELVRVIDVAPTLLDAVGIEPPANLDGRSLLPALREADDALRWAYGESGRSFMGTDPERSYAGVEGKQRMLRTRDWKLVFTPGPGDGRTQLFDLRKDPGERRDVADQHPERVAALRSEFEGVLASEKPRGTDRALSDEEIERLKSLGYMQ